MNDSSIEMLYPIYINEKLASIKSPFYLRRMDFWGKRFYYEVDEESNPTFYLSTTTFIKSVLPESKFLTDWRINTALFKGSQEAADEYVTSTADYGTCLHICIGEVIKNGKYDWSKLLVTINEYCENKIDAYTLRGWVKDLQKDVLAFCQFIKEYNVNVVAVEFPIIGDGIATCIDLVVEMDIEEKGFWGEVYLSGAQKGLPKETKQTRRVVSIIDIKSGRKGFYDSHEAQLELCKKMWNAYFEGTDYECEMIFNWSPKDWVSSPSFNLKDQTNSKFKDKTDVMFQMGAIYNVFNFSRFSVESTDVFKLGDDPVFKNTSIYDTVRNYELEKKVK